MSKFNTLFALAQKSLGSGKCTLDFKSEGEGTLTLKMTGLPKSYDAAGIIAHAGAVGASLSGRREVVEALAGIAGTFSKEHAGEFAKRMIVTEADAGAEPDVVHPDVAAQASRRNGRVVVNS